MSAAGIVGGHPVHARVAQGWYAALWSDPAHATKGRITTDRIAHTYSLPAAAMQSPASSGRGLGCGVVSPG